MFKVILLLIGSLARISCTAHAFEDSFTNNVISLRKLDEGSIEIKWNNNINDDDESRLRGGGDDQTYVITKVLKVKEMPSVFASDATIDIVNENLVVESELASKYQSRQLLAKADKDNGDDWAIFSERNGKIYNGIFTHDGGKQLLQVNHIDSMDEDVKNRRLSESKNMVSDHFIQSITPEYVSKILGPKHSDHRKLDENDNPSPCGTDTESKESKQRVPRKERKGNSGVKKDASGKDIEPEEFQQTTIINSQTSTLTPFFPGCFDGDAITREFKIGIAVDYGLYTSLGGTLEGTIREVEAIVESTRLLYLNQLSILLVVGKIVIGNSNSRFPLNMSPTDRTCVTDSYYALSEFGKWNAATNDGKDGLEMGHWNLLTNCWKAPGVVGIANVGSLCDDQRNVAITSRLSATGTWLIFAHELGHGFGANHVFNVGGVMDYGRPTFNGAIQFHPNNKAEMCRELAFRAPTCKYFTVRSQDPVCGNSLVEGNEECECLENGKTDCSSCKNCKLTNSRIQCSTKDFVMRSTNENKKKDFVSAILDNLSDAQCCSSSGVMFEPTTTCNGGVDVCVQGKCTAFCSNYFVESCKVINDGCKQPCKYRGSTVCHNDLMAQSTRTYINWIPDGVVCGKGKGVCTKGECVESAPTTPTVPPTSGVVITKKPTTKAPTFQDEQGTTPPTQSEVKCPSKKIARLCGSQKTAGRCTKRSKTCQWCNEKCTPKTPNGCMDNYNIIFSHC